MNGEVRTLVKEKRILYGRWLQVRNEEVKERYKLKGREEREK